MMVRTGPKRPNSQNSNAEDKAREESQIDASSSGSLSIPNKPQASSANMSADTGASSGMSANDMADKMNTARRQKKDSDIRTEALKDRSQDTQPQKKENKKSTVVSPSSVTKDNEDAIAKPVGKQFARPGEIFGNPSEADNVSFDSNELDGHLASASKKNESSTKRANKKSSKKKEKNKNLATASVRISDTSNEDIDSDREDRNRYVPGKKTNLTTESPRPMDIVRVGNESRLMGDPDRPRTVIGPSDTAIPMPPRFIDEDHLLPGHQNLFPYRVARTKENAGKSDDELILEAMNNAASLRDYSAMYPNEIESTTVEGTRFEDYAEDYNTGNTDNGKYDDNLSTRQKNALNSEQRVRDYIKRAFIPLESQYVDEDDFIRYSIGTETAINNFMQALGLAPEQRDIVFQMVIKYMGFSPDRNGFFLGADENDFKMDDEVFQHALLNILKSCQKFGHPYAMVERNFIYGGTRCFPIGVMDINEARALCNSSSKFFRGEDPYKLMIKAGDEWINQTLPDLKRNVLKQDNGQAQMAVIEDIVRAITGLMGTRSSLFGVSESVQRGYDDFMAQTDISNYDKPDEWDRKVSEYQQKQSRRAMEIMRKRKYKTKSTYSKDVVDENGVILHRRGDRVMPWNKYDASTMDQSDIARKEGFFATTAAIARFNGVVLNVPIMASGIVEHAQGNLLSYISNHLMLGFGSDYAPNSKMYDLITSDESVEAISAWKALLQVGGQEAVMEFVNEGRPLTKENAKQFLNEYVNRETRWSKKVDKLRREISYERDANKKKLLEAELAEAEIKKRRSRTLKDKLNEVTDLLVPGDIGFRKADARRWLEGFMINNRNNARTRGTSTAAMERGFTAQEILEMMEAEGLPFFLAKMTGTNAGRDAMLMTRNQTLAREAPLTHATEVLLRKTGIGNFAVTMAIDTYFKYGISLLQLMFPLSNTISYLIVRGANNRATGGIQNTDDLNLNILNYQMGGNDSFARGLLKNFIYDAVKLGNTTLIAGFIYLLLDTLGFDDPPDENNQYNFEEYLIGGKMGWGEDGKGIPVYMAWWMNDLTLFGAPMAYAMAVHKLHPDDQELPWKVFIEGCGQMVSGASLLDMIKVINNCHSDFQAVKEAMDDPDKLAPPGWDSYFLMQAELFTAKAANKMIPSSFKNWRKDTAIVGQDEYDRNSFKVYDRDKSRPGATKSVEDWGEVQRRIESKNNPLYALFNNITKNGYLFDDGTTGKTGYLFDEMPIQTFPDQQRAYWANKYDYDPDDIPGGEENRIPYTESKCEEVIADIETFNSPEEAANNGFMIGYDLREKLRDYCYQHINAAENVFNYNKENGLKADYQEMSNKKSYYYDILKNWVFNEDIPWSDEGYAKLLSDNTVQYYWKDSGAPATSYEQWMYGDAVEKRFVPKGNHPTSLFPFTTADSQGKGYNFETKVSWNKGEGGGTNLQNIFERNKNEEAKVPYGKDAGVEVNTAIFGGQPNTATEAGNTEGIYNALDDPTMGYRGYVPFDERMLDNLPNVRIKEDENGKKVNDSGLAGNAMTALKSVGREDVGSDSSLGDLGKYVAKDSWSTSSSPNWGNQSWPTNGKRNYTSGKSYSSSNSPKIYSNPRSVNADKAATMYAKQPYNAVNSYLRPSFSTKGSREAYKRQDM